MGVVSTCPQHSPLKQFWPNHHVYPPAPLQVFRFAQHLADPAEREELDRQGLEREGDRPCQLAAGECTHLCRFHLFSFSFLFLFLFLLSFFPDIYFCLLVVACHHSIVFTWNGNTSRLWSPTSRLWAPTRQCTCHLRPGTKCVFVCFYHHCYYYFVWLLLWFFSFFFVFQKLFQKIR
jgi:hypothetical protein